MNGTKIIEDPADLIVLLATEVAKPIREPLKVAL